ncbi:hypothetical protein [Acanthopleuribacter pedis]|uniref:Uncharacterized protein n=1 Tax=Acanthopleuribacter pedis TaxID=442870 RepID=A0A8J7U453_9BACT|nr:hypothetical protein [Acanthopleuribacter pedis]MBO1319033.1 hypothetical protein [Acanthopleuribacter pedis]
MANAIAPILHALFDPRLWLLVFLFQGATLHAAKNRLLVLGPDSLGYDQVLTALNDELEDEFDIVQRTVHRETPYRDFERHILEVQPDLMVLMDNVTISYYRFFQDRHRGRLKFPPAIVTMALFVDQSILGMENVVGVRYEVPPILSLTHLRALIDNPVERVGVLYRAEHANYFNDQKILCAREGIELVGYKVEVSFQKGGGEAMSKIFSKEIRNGLKYLVATENVDVLLVLNDNKLLNERDVRNVWLPRLKRFRKPILVGVETLMDIPHFGNFGVLPDHYGLGQTVGNLAIEIKENDFALFSKGATDPHSVRKHLDRKFARKYLDIQPDKLNEVDVLR